nr:odorant binding protein 9 [Trissolcus basalis]
MSFLVRLFVVVLIVNYIYGFKYAEMPAKVQDALSDCKEKLGILDAEELEVMMSANDSKMDCLHACILKHLGAMDDTGSLNPAKISSLANEFKSHDMTDDYILTLTTHCMENVKPDMDECKAAATFMNCAVEKDHPI